MYTTGVDPKISLTVAQGHGQKLFRDHTSKFFLENFQFLCSKLACSKYCLSFKNGWQFLNKYREGQGKVNYQLDLIWGC